MRQRKKHTERLRDRETDRGWEGETGVTKRQKGKREENDRMTETDSTQVLARD